MSAVPLPGNRDAPPERDWRLLDLRETRRLIVGWTLLYGGGSWLLEYGYASLGATPGSFAAAGKNAVYALVWAPLLFGAVWLVDRWPVRSVFDVRRVVLHLGAITIAPFLWGAATYYLCLVLVPGWQPWGIWRMYLKTSWVYCTSAWSSLAFATSRTGCAASGSGSSRPFATRRQRPVRRCMSFRWSCIRTS